MFDVEAVFIFPWATQLEVYGGFGLVEMGVFIVRPASSASSTPGARGSCGGCDALMGLVEKGRLPKPLTNLLNISRKYSLWVYQWGLACCAIEMGAAFGSPRYDVMRLGVIPFPASPRQADLVVISGTVTDKMAPGRPAALRADARPQVRHLDGLVRQLRRPVLGLATRSPRASTRSSRSTCTCPGCPPRPEALLEGIVLLQERIRNEDMAERWKADISEPMELAVRGRRADEAMRAAEERGEPVVVR